MELVTGLDEATLRDALRRLNRAANGKRDDRSLYSIPPNPHRDADLILVGLIDEVLVLRQQQQAAPVVAAAQRAIVAASRERARLLAAPEASLTSDEWLAAWWEANDRIFAAVAALAYLLDPAADVDGEQS